MEHPAPLIVTLGLDEGSFDSFDRLRRTHFPPERNFIPAHVTLFHHLPGSEIERVRAVLAGECARTAPFALGTTGLRFLGRGVAIDVAAPDLIALRERLATAFEPWLTPQDRQRWRPHVTIQNKVAPQIARALYEDLTASLAPIRGRAEGLLLWHYRGGPWQKAGRYAFDAARDDVS